MSLTPSATFALTLAMLFSRKPPDLSKKPPTVAGWLKIFLLGALAVAACVWAIVWTTRKSSPPPPPPAPAPTHAPEFPDAAWFDIDELE